MDVRTIYIDMSGGDLDFAGPDFVADDGLDTAVILSLFSDRRANTDDSLPLGQSDLRGWWADAFSDDGDLIGSRLWLLQASKQLPQVLAAARQYAEEALAWLVSDGVAKSVSVETFIARSEVMGMNVRITRPDGAERPLRFELLWSSYGL